MDKLKRPIRRTVGRITVPGDAWDRVFGRADEKPSPEVASPGEWVVVTCKNHECPEHETYESWVAQTVYDVIPPSCPVCGHELEAINHGA